MFRGLSTVTLDGQGRLAIPTRYRELLLDHCAGELVATIDTSFQCLLFYPVPRWNEIQERIEGLPSMNPEVRKIQRLLIGHARDMKMDASGRVLLDARLRSHARLEKHVVLVGQGQKLELWDEEYWQTSCNDWLEETQGSQLPDELKGLSI